MGWIVTVVDEDRGIVDVIVPDGDGDVGIRFMGTWTEHGTLGLEVRCAYASARIDLAGRC